MPIAIGRRAWLLLPWLFAITGLAWAQTPTPARGVMTPPVFRATPTASLSQWKIPNGVPAPPAIPPIPALRNPLTVKPKSVFGGHTIHSDGTTDDTAGIQAALNASDIIVAPATYAIAGNVTIPTGRNISCQSGAIFFDTQSKGTRMFQIGYGNPASNGNNSIIGCTFKGTDTADNYSTYLGGNSGYSELLEISTGNGQHTDNVLIQNNAFLDAQGDSIITYSPCGPNNTGAPCNGGAPGTEGPSNIFIVNNTFSHCVQPGVHLNGGQNLVVNGNTLTDCTGDDEADSNVLQVMTSWWFNNKFTTQYGTLNSLNGKIVGPEHSCTGDDLIPEDDSGCWSFNNQIDGVGSGGASILREPSGCAGGGGHYLNESLTNGAQLRTGC
jgi:hypothetical protein